MYFSRYRQQRGGFCLNANAYLEHDGPGSSPPVLSVDGVEHEGVSRRLRSYGDRYCCRQLVVLVALGCWVRTWIGGCRFNTSPLR